MKRYVADFETLKCCIMLGFYNFEEDEWKIFEISEYNNDLYAFIKFYDKTQIEYCVFYNGIGFDCQVTEFILANYEKWVDLTNLQMCGKVYEFVQRLIDDQSYGLFVPYREERFEIPCIDVFTILGLNNEARYSSLKKCQFQLDYPSVEEMPIHHGIEYLTKEEVEQIESYMKNDILSTYVLYKLVMGDTDHPIYKGNNQLDLRANIREEFGINCTNYSDIKIGDEIIKHYYAKAIGKDLKDLPRKGYFRKQIRLVNCIPDYIEFKTKQLQDLLASIKSKSISQVDRLENKFTFYKTKYVQALGGLHSENDNQVFQETDEYEIHDYDVALG